MIPKILKENHWNMRLSGLLVAAAIALSSTSALAEDRPVSYSEIALGSTTAQTMWADFMPFIKSDAQAADGSIPPSVLIWQTQAGEHLWTVTALNVRDFCGISTCSTRVFRDSDLFMTADACNNFSAHVLRPDANEFEACGEVTQLSRIEQR